METKNTNQSEKKIGFLGKSLATAALCGTLMFGATSCGRTTAKDVDKQRQKVETVSYKLSTYINQRKGFVEKYNNLLSYSATDENQNDIKKSLGQLYNVISDYDKKIAELAKDKIKAEDKLSQDIANCFEPGVSLPSGPIAADRRDFLLDIM